MPTCVNCAPTSTPVAIEGIGQVLVTGSGTALDPVKIMLVDTDSSFALTVRDTDTVNMSLYGTGSEDDPYVISADTGSAFKLTDLADIDSDPPTAGQVPTWVGNTTGGHWEFQTPVVPVIDDNGDVAASRLTGTINNARLSGVLATTTGYVNGDWNTLLQPGMFRCWATATNTNAPAGAYLFGTLVVFASGNSVTQVYYEHGNTAGNTIGTGQTMWWRTKWNASDWTSWSTTARVDSNYALADGAAFTPLSGYTMSSAKLTRSGNTVTLYLNLASAAAITNTSYPNGDIPGFQVGTIPAAHAPEYGNGPMATAGQGLGYQGYVDTTGKVYISTMPSGITTTAGAAITTGTNTPIVIAGTWVAKEMTS